MSKIYTEEMTADGSTTLYSPYFDEHCHSLLGALEETQTRYIQGTNLLAYLNFYSPLRILEVGFGQGLGLVALQDLLFKNHQTKNRSQIFFQSLEIDSNLVELAKKNIHRWVPNLKPETFDIIRNLTWDSTSNAFVAKNSQIHFEIKIGDARNSIKELKNNFYHIVFQDPFSPKKNPHLWTSEYFRDLKSIIHPMGILSTYSADIRARKSMLLSGWKIHKGPNFNNKKSSTIAYQIGEHHPQILKSLQSEKILPYHDHELLAFTWNHENEHTVY